MSVCDSAKYERTLTGELHCVDECADWWYRANDYGLCEEQKWRKNTAIAVPIVVVLVLVIAVVVIVLVRKASKKAEKTEKGKPEAAMRDNVANA